MTPREEALSSQAKVSSQRARRPAKPKWRMAARISLPMPLPWCSIPNHEPLSATPVRWKFLAKMSWTPTIVGSGSRNTTAKPRPQPSLVQSARCRQFHCNAWRSSHGDGVSVHGLENGIIVGSWIPRRIRSTSASRSSSVGGRNSRRGVRTRMSNNGQ